MILKVAGHDMNPSIWIIRNPEEGQTVYVIPMRMSKQQVGRSNVPLQEFLANAANAGARVEQETMVADPHFDATGVSAEPDMIW